MRVPMRLNSSSTARAFTPASASVTFSGAAAPWLTVGAAGDEACMLARGRARWPSRSLSPITPPPVAGAWTRVGSPCRFSRSIRA